MTYDVIIIGAGAAGLFCAIEAGRRGRRALVIERNGQAGRKILISGGGRCNFTNLLTTPDNFVSENPHFCRSALSRFTPEDFIRLVKKHRIEFYEKKLGQLFCRGSSRQIVEMLLTECERAGVDVRLSCSVESVGKGDLFEIETSAGSFRAEKLVVATGGLSYPKIGATDLGYRIARQFGLQVTETRPSLVAMVAANGGSFPKLAGISVDASIEVGKQRFRENILFTHRGLSGPAVLQASNYWTINEPVSIDLLPDQDLSTLLIENRRSTQKLSNFLGRYLPQKLAADFLLGTLHGKALDQLSNSEIDTVVEALSAWRVHFSGTEGYDRAEVTLGGVSTSELSSKTMESLTVPGLYFIGEVVDVTGWLGGFNFQWAWASAHAVGTHV